MEIDREDTDAAGKWLGKQVAPWKDKSPDVLFVGDSYFELGDHDDYAGKHLFGKVFRLPTSISVSAEVGFAIGLTGSTASKTLPLRKKL